MQLDRNITQPDGSKRGKYALIKLRIDQPETICDGKIICVKAEAVDFGDTPDTDFFVIRLKDKYAAAALHAYAAYAAVDDIEYARQVKELAMLAERHPNRQIPT